MVMGDRVITPHVVCQGCLLADSSGQPRWQGGQLRCGQALQKLHTEQPERFECQMGFTVANIQ